MDAHEKTILKRLNTIDKKIKRLQLLNLPATLVIGLSAYAKFSHNAVSLHPLFGEDNVVNGALAIAIPWSIVCVVKLTKLSTEMSKLKRGIIL